MKNYKETIDTYSLVKNKTDIKKALIKNGDEAYLYAKQFYFEDLEIYESMFIILLDRAGVTEGYVKISQGGTAGTVCDVKLIAKYAIESLANGVILIHNHPSGQLKPSSADIAITKRIKEALLLLDITLLDHIIITTNGYYSMEQHSNF